MEPMPLSFETLMAYVNRAIGQMKDPRQRSNATQYRLRDVILGAFWSINANCPVVVVKIMPKICLA
jgi:hypothetical protein